VKQQTNYHIIVCDEKLNFVKAEAPGTKLIVQSRLPSTQQIHYTIAKLNAHASHHCHHKCTVVSNYITSIRIHKTFLKNTKENECLLLRVL